MKSFKEFMTESPYLASGHFEWKKSDSGFHSRVAFERIYSVVDATRLNGVLFFFCVMKHFSPVIARVFVEENGGFLCVAEVKFKKTLTFKPSPVKNLIQVHSANTAEEYQSFGLVSHLYVSLIAKGYAVASDATQFTPGANLWKHIARESTMRGLKVRLFNGEEFMKKNGKDVIYNGSNVDDSLIWSSGEDFAGYGIILIAAK